MYNLRTASAARAWLLLFLLSCAAPEPQELVLYDFESDRDLDRLEWTCHALMSLASDSPVAGRRSLKAELYPSDFPGVVLEPRKGSWRRYSRFHFSVRNTSGKYLTLSVGIDDGKDHADARERYVGTYVIRPGLNRVSIPLAALVRQHDSAPLDLDHIRQVQLFLTRPSVLTVLYLDDVGLAR